MNWVQHRGSEETPTGQGMHKCYACVDLVTLHVIRCVLRGQSCVLSVAREGTGQRVVGTRQMDKGNPARVMEGEVRVIIGDPVVLPVDVI